MTDAVRVIVPCYNEAERLPVDRFVEFIESGPPGYDFLFVDDGSTDETAAVVKKLAEGRESRVSLLVLENNGGKAEAVRAGAQAALGMCDSAFIAYWDADLATPLDALPDFVATFESRPETRLVMGARVALLGRHIERNTFRHYIGRIFATGASLVLGLPVYDTQCGAKMFRVTPGLGELFDKPFIAGWSFDVELIARMVNQLARDGGPTPADAIYELPLTRWTDVSGSKVKPLDFFVALYQLLKIHDEYRR